MSKPERYALLLAQMKGLLEGESDRTANLANAAALIHGSFDFWWTGFYLVKGEELVLGPFQGPIACTRIPYGKGVCGTAWARRETVVVPDVHLFPGHIACDAASESEIVVPLKTGGRLVGVLDIDSPKKHTFGEDDRAGLERFAEILSSALPGDFPASLL